MSSRRRNTTCYANCFMHSWFTANKVKGACPRNSRTPRTRTWNGVASNQSSSSQQQWNHPAGAACPIELQHTLKKRDGNTLSLPVNKDTEQKLSQQQRNSSVPVCLTLRIPRLGLQSHLKVHQWPQHYRLLWPLKDYNHNTTKNNNYTLYFDLILIPSPPPHPPIKLRKTLWLLIITKKQKSKRLHINAFTHTKLN